MRAAIYSLEPLATPLEQKVRDGIDMVAACIGEAVTTRAVQVRLPQELDGRVKHRRIGFANLDAMTELHVMAIPLANTGTRSGVSGVSVYESGVSFVDIDKHNRHIIRETTAHECAHSLGFVENKVSHTLNGSVGHCQSEDCLMSPSICTIVEPEVVSYSLPQSRLSKMLRRNPKMAIATFERLINVQEDFCNDCKHDMQNSGQQKLGNLRMERILYKQVSKFNVRGGVLFR